MALTLVGKGDTNVENVVEGQFGRPSTADQLRAIADRLDRGDFPEPDYMATVFGYDDPRTNMSVQIGGARDAHPYFIAGMLQNATLCGLDEAAAMAYMEEEQE